LGHRHLDLQFITLKNKTTKKKQQGIMEWKVLTKESIEKRKMGYPIIESVLNLGEWTVCLKKTMKK